MPQQTDWKDEVVASEDHSITAISTRDGDLLFFQTVKAFESDDVCQQVRRRCRPVYGEAFRIEVQPIRARR